MLLKQIFMTAYIYSRVKLMLKHSSRQTETQLHIHFLTKESQVSSRAVNFEPVILSLSHVNISHSLLTWYSEYTAISLNHSSVFQYVIQCITGIKILFLY